MPEIETQEQKITYPVFFNPYPPFETYLLPIFFGGTEFNEDEVTSKNNRQCDQTWPNSANVADFGVCAAGKI